MLFAIIALCIVFLVGLIAGLFFCRKDSIGNLIIVDDPDDGPYMFIELTKTDVHSLRRQNSIELKVVDRRRYPQK